MLRSEPLNLKFYETFDFCPYSTVVEVTEMISMPCQHYQP